MLERGDNPAVGRNDMALVVAAQAGDADAYVLLVERHASRLLGLARRLLGNEQDAEDAVQEAFLRAHRALAGFRGESGFGTWLYRIALNACRDLGRAHARIDEERLVRETEERFLDEDYAVDPERRPDARSAPDGPRPAGGWRGAGVRGHRAHRQPDGGRVLPARRNPANGAVRPHHRRADERAVVGRAAIEDTSRSAVSIWHYAHPLIVPSPRSGSAKSLDALATDLCPLQG